MTGALTLAGDPANALHAATKQYIDAAIAGIAATAGGFPSGTAMLFVQSAAPTGWTKQTAHNDKALRIVSGSITSGGVYPFSSVFSRTATDGLGLSIAMLPPHDHGLGGILDSGGAGSAGPSFSNQGYSGGGSSARTDSTGNGAAHAHGIDIRVQYLDTIYATKN